MSDKSYNISQIGNWPYERYIIQPDETKIDPRLGFLPFVNYFPMNFQSSYLFDENGEIDYNFNNIPSFFNDDLYLKMIDLSNGDSFSLTLSTIRKNYNYDLYNTFSLFLDEPEGKKIVGYCLYPTKPFLKPLSAQKTINGWAIKTSAILISATPFYFSEINFLAEKALDINQNYQNRFSDKIEIPITNNLIVTYSLSSVQKFMNRPIIDFTPVNNPIFFNTNLEDAFCKILKDSFSVYYNHEYFDFDGSFQSIGSSEEFNNQKQYTFFDSVLFNYKPSINKNEQTFLMLQSAVNPNIPFDSPLNCVLSSVLDCSNTNFKYFVKSFSNQRNIVPIVSGRSGSQLKVKYISESPRIRNTNENVASTILRFENPSLTNNIFNSCSTTQSFDVVYWETKYPPHHYIYNINFRDRQLTNTDPSNSLYFDLSANVTYPTITSADLKTILFSNYGLLVLDLKEYGVLDRIKFEILGDVNSILYSNISCYYSDLKIPYDHKNSPWIPAASGANFYIEYLDSSLGEYKFLVLPKLSTYSGFIESYYPTTIVLNKDFQQILNPLGFEQEILLETSNLIRTSVSSLSSPNITFLDNSQISWYIDPPNSDVKIYNINDVGDFLIIPPNSSITFNDITNNVYVSGYLDTTIKIFLSSQKYNAECFVITNSALFDKYQEGYIKIGEIEKLNNLEEIRTIALSARIPVGEKLYNFPNDSTAYWNFYYNGESLSDKITARKFDGSDYIFGDYDLIQNIKDLRFFIKPEKNKLFPKINNVKFEFNIFKPDSTITTGFYDIEIDDFPDLEVFDLNFYTTYQTETSVKLSQTIKNQSLVRVFDNTCKFKIINDKNISSDWLITNNKGFVSAIKGYSDFNLKITGVNETKILNSVTNYIVPNWLSGHNFKKESYIYTLNSDEFKPLKFNIYSEFFWPSGRNLKISDSTNYTESLMPTAYKGTVNNTYSFWISANKNFENFIVNGVESSQTTNPFKKEFEYSSSFNSPNGFTVSITGFGEIFKKENGLFYPLSTTNGLILSSYPITATSYPFNSQSPNFQKSPILKPLESVTFSFSIPSSSIDLSSDRFISINQTVCSIPENSPTRIVGGTITYILSSDYWISYKNVKVENLNNFSIFGLTVGDLFLELNVSDLKQNTLTLTASAEIEKTIPESTFNDYPNFSGLKKLWEIQTEKIQPKQFLTINCFLTSNNLEIYTNERQTLIGRDLYFEVINKNFGPNVKIEKYIVDFGDSHVEEFTENIFKHQYLIDGSFYPKITGVLNNSEKYVKTYSKIDVYKEYKKYNGEDLRFLTEFLLDLPYKFNEIEIQPNEYGDVDIFNTAITRIYKNLEYLENNSQTFDYNSPTIYYGWLGSNINNSYLGIKWHTDDYNFSEKNNPQLAVNFGSTFFTKIEKIEKKSDYLFVLDNGKLRIFKDINSTIIEYEFLNYEEIFKNYSSIFDFTVDSDLNIFILDKFGSKISKIVFDVESLLLYFYLEIGGNGDADKTQKFNNPSLIKTKGENLYVLDSGNNCIKIYDLNLNWKKTIKNPYENSEFKTFDISNQEEYLFVLDNTNIVFIYDNFEFLETLNFQSFNNFETLNFDNFSGFLYLGDLKNVKKFTLFGAYVTDLNIPQNYNIFYSSFDNNRYYVGYDKFIYSFYENYQKFSLLNSNYKRIWELSDILLKKENFASSYFYNKTLNMMIDNIKNLRNSLIFNFSLVQESQNFGSATYFSRIPVKSENLPSFSNYIENQKNIGVGANEFHIPQVLNREFLKIYEALEILKDFLDIKNVNNALNNNCGSTFCWSWKSMSCYSLSLPIIKLCNINPITWKELEKDFYINYAPSKNWNSAISNCCSDKKSPLTE